MLVITDGRDDYLKQTLKSAAAELPWRHIVGLFVVDDKPGRTKDPKPISELDDVMGDRFFAIARPRIKKRGFGGAINAGWDLIRQHADRLDVTHVFHLEDDFTFNEPVDLLSMSFVLADNKAIQQVALQRQPIAANEVAAGGVIASWANGYVECQMSVPMTTFVDDDGADIAAFEIDGPLATWCEHDLFFTTNPSLYRLELTTEEWPAGAGSEAAFTARLKAMGLRFAYWGAKTDRPKVHHIGDHRAGTGY